MDIYYFRWGANNVGITCEDVEVVREVMAVLSDAQNSKRNTGVK